MKKCPKTVRLHPANPTIFYNKWLKSTSGLCYAYFIK